MSGRDVVDKHWPFDGPHSDDSRADAATAIERLMRYLANATWRPAESGPGLYRLLGGIGAAVAHLDQVLGQLGEITGPALAEDRSMYDDRRDRAAADTVDTVVAQLGEARRALASSGARLMLAAQTASHLGHDQLPADDRAVSW